MKKVDAEIRAGEVIEIQDKGRYRLAVVLRDEGKQARFRVLMEDGREASVAAKQLGLRLGTLPAEASLETLAMELHSLRVRVEARVGQAAVEELWSLVAGESMPVDVPAAADLWFGEQQPEALLAAAVALREDKIYFKERGELFEARSESQVEDLLRTQAVLVQREAQRERFVQVARSLLLQAPEVREATYAEVLNDPALLASWEVVEAFVVGGAESSSRAEAEALLDAVQQRAGRALEGSGLARAFRFLVGTGHWRPDENVFLRRYRIPETFAPELLAAEAALLAQWPELMASRAAERLNLEAHRVFSVDDVETMDIDDAVSVEVLGQGRHRLWIHIAAPTLFVPFASPLEVEARRRATSLYLPTHRVPMFPFALSEGLFSLLQGELRPALSFCVDFDASHEQSARQDVSAQIHRTWVRVGRRFTYDEADDLLESGLGEWAEDLQVVHLCAENLRQARYESGAVEIDLPEHKARVDAAGRVHIKVNDLNSMAREMVAELAILANTVAARFCGRSGIAVAFRGQEKPTVPLDEDAFAEIPAGIPRAMAMRRCMMPAGMHLEPAPHAGLGVDAYVQSTSPIRRYTDLLTHYQIEHYLEHGQPLLDAEAVAAILALVEQSSLDARAADRDSTRYWMLRYLEQRQDQTQDGVIIAYAERGDFAQVVLLDTMLRVNLSTRRRLPIGTVVPVAIERVQAMGDQLQVRLADEK